MDKLFLSLLPKLLIYSLILGCKKPSKDNDSSYTLAALVLDFESHNPLSGAKVFVYVAGFAPIDSALTNANGYASFSYKTGDGRKTLRAAKVDYLQPFYITTNLPISSDRTDTLYLARPSLLRITTMRTGPHQANDSIKIRVNNYPSFIFTGQSYPNNYEFRRLANAADTTVILPMVYYQAPNEKAYVHWEIIRGTTTIFSQSDSVVLLQHSTKNYTLSY